MAFNFKITVFAFLTWLFPMVLSMLLIEEDGSGYLPNFPVFKTIMLVMLFSLTYFFYGQLRKKEIENWLRVATLFTVVCSLLDMIVLIGIFDMTILMWLLAIFPFYIISFFGIGVWRLKSKN